MNNIILGLLVIDFIILVILVLTYKKYSSFEASRSIQLIFRMLIGAGVIGLGVGGAYYYFI